MKSPILEHRPVFSVDEGKMTEQPETEIWARSSDGVGRLADSIVQALWVDMRPWVDVACIGAGAINQALKATIVARQKLEPEGEEITVMPYFSVIIDDHDRERTRMMLRLVRYCVEPQSQRQW